MSEYQYSPSNIYEEAFNEETTLDLSSKRLETVPHIANKSIRMLYLQNNNITTLPDDFFPSLPTLMWLDLRDNKLTDIPKSIESHPCLTHLLLQNNRLTSLPVELGTLPNLKVLQLNGNPVMFPPRAIIDAGTSEILQFLLHSHMEAFTESQAELSEAEDSASAFPESIFGHKIRSYNSVIDQDKLVKNMSVRFIDKDADSDTEEHYSKFKGKCPRLAVSRTSFPPKTQSAKYLKPLVARNKSEQEDRMKRSFLKEVALKKNKDLLASRDKIIQDRKNLKSNDKKDDSDTEEAFRGKCLWLAGSRTSFPPKTQNAVNRKPIVRRKSARVDTTRNFLETNKNLLATRDKILQEIKSSEYLREWRRSYREGKSSRGSYKMSAKDFPYDTSPEYMTLLTREDIERDLPDKYRRKLQHRSKPSVPRKSTSDVQLAMKIKKLFEKLDSINMAGRDMTPRTEQKVLLNEIHKISEIKQKLMELSVANGRSVEPVSE